LSARRQMAGRFSFRNSFHPSSSSSPEDEETAEEVNGLAEDTSAGEEAVFERSGAEETTAPFLLSWELLPPPPPTIGTGANAELSEAKARSTKDESTLRRIDMAEELWPLPCHGQKKKQGNANHEGPRCLIVCCWHANTYGLPEGKLK
jgi:hypothetical protein